MRAALVILSSLLATAALAQSEVVHRAKQIILERRLLTKEEMACSVYVVADHGPGTMAEVRVHRKQGKGCGGDTHSMPRRFTLEIDMATGLARWDGNPEMEMRPLPAD
ncbi:hypothetical protein [Microvirga pudoricolor]|uniref:hypothetical protein n=1 Tax=Microvirga pudoricolor TaxID=2778729 RepID=UPI001951760B|nr:hypothetical protein [Microvirga pudoricolor]MBM6592517.1 hypothetical protein [Microvirga pudoricolor]